MQENPSKKDSKIGLLEQIYDLFPYQLLGDLDFHVFLMNIIDKD